MFKCLSALMEKRKKAKVELSDLMQQLKNLTH
jgi:hypothetical protein